MAAGAYERDRSSRRSYLCERLLVSPSTPHVPSVSANLHRGRPTKDACDLSSVASEVSVLLNLYGQQKSCSQRACCSRLGKVTRSNLLFFCVPVRTLERRQHGSFRFKEISLELRVRRREVAHVENSNQRRIQVDIRLVKVGGVFQLTKYKSKLG